MSASGQKERLTGLPFFTYLYKVEYTLHTKYEIHLQATNCFPGFRKKAEDFFHRHVETKIRNIAIRDFIFAICLDHYFLQYFILK